MARQRGKFEESGGIGKWLYRIVQDGGCNDEVGNVGDFGWYGLVLDSEIPGAPYAIVSEDNDGFFDFTAYKTERAALKAWDKIVAEASEYYGEEQ